MSDLSDSELRVLLDLWMVSDPFPLPDEQQECFTSLLDEESEKRGYDSISIAYHRHNGGL